MEFMVGDDDGLCRYDGKGWHEALKADGVWCANGYAYGVFLGVEKGYHVTETEAVEYVMKDYSCSEDKAKSKLYEKGLDKEESIEYLAKFWNWSLQRAARSLGFTLNNEGEDKND